MKNTKVRWIVFISIPVLLVSMLVMVLYFVSNADTYENIKIFEINGEVVIERKTKEKVDTYENMNLMSGDIITVAKDSNAKLQLDDDKYALMEPNTKLEIESIGQEKNGKFKLKLISGALITEIQNKLDANSSFDINTPNSTMSVRGTVFRIEVIKDAKGSYVTNLQVYEGKVEVNINDKENSTIFVEKGKSAQIIGENSDAKYEYTNNDLDISKLPDCALKYLNEINDSGRELSLTTSKETETTVETANTELSTGEGAETSTHKATEESKKTNSNNTNNTGNTDSNIVEPAVTSATEANKELPVAPEVTSVPVAVTQATTQAPVTSAAKATITYNLGSGRELISLQYNSGEIVEPITDFSVGGRQTIEGWYTDSSLTTKWDFSKPITQDLYLYAKYITE